MPQDSSRLQPPSPLSIHLEIEHDHRYRSGREDERSELGNSVEGEDDVTNPQRSCPPPPPRGSLTQPSYPKYLLPQGNAPSCRRQSPNSRPTQGNDDENLDKSNLQRHGRWPYISDPLHQTPSGSSPVLRPAVSAPEQPSRNSRTPTYPSSQGPSQLLCDHSVRSTGRGAGHHSASTGPHNKSNLSSNDRAVLFPESGTQKEVEPNHKMDASWRQLEVCSGAISDAEAKRKEAETKKRDAKAQRFGAESEARVAEFEIQEAEFLSWEAEFWIREAEFQTQESEFQI